MSVALFSADVDGFAMFGEGSSDGWIVEAVTGLWSTGEYRSDRVTLPGRHGAAPSGPDVLAAGSLEFELARTGDPAEVGAACRHLVAAWAPRSTMVDLVVRAADDELLIRGRPLGCDVDTSLLYAGAARARCVFERLDPLWYADSEALASLVLEPLTGGFTTPLVTPLVTTTAGGSRDAVVAVGGTAPTPWSMFIHPTTALVDPFVSIDGAPVVQMAGTIPVGSTVELDQRTRVMTVDGYVRPWVRFGSSWAGLSPGAHTVSLRAAAGSATAEFSWRDAWF